MLALAALASSAPWFLLAACLAGATSCAIQVLVPLAAAMAHPQRRGSTVGNVMSGVMLGICCPGRWRVSLPGQFGWRAFYGLLAVLDGSLALLLWHWLPTTQPAGGRVLSQR